jgi:hypothetical protein
MRKQSRYLSYLVRLWQASQSDEAGWHASIENPLTGVRQGFANLDLLFAFLREQTSHPAETPAPLIDADGAPETPATEKRY